MFINVGAYGTKALCRIPMRSSDRARKSANAFTSAPGAIGGVLEPVNARL